MIHPNSPNHHELPLIDTDELIANVKRFWGRGFYTETVPFADQLDDIKNNPNKRQNILRTQPSAILTTNYGEPCSKVDFTEAEGMMDLEDFIATVKNTAAANPSDEESKKIGDEASAFIERFTFLGNEEVERACAGIAALWADYLAEDPHRTLNLYEFKLSDDQTNRSYNWVTGKVVEEFMRLTDGKPTASRLFTSPGTWQEGEGAKLVILDDWAITGNTVDQMIASVERQARLAGKTGLLKDLEVHLLIARKEQIEQPQQTDRGTSYKIRGYYQAPFPGDYRGGIPSGSHSEADYGFSNVLREMASYLKAHGVLREFPLLGAVDRPYNPGHVADEALLREIARLNGEVVSLEKERKDKAEIRKLSPGNIDQASEEEDETLKSQIAHTLNKCLDLIDLYHKRE